MLNFYTALTFLTILPAPPRPAVDAGKSVAYFPLAGLVLGALLAAVDRLGAAALSPELRAATDVFFLALATGGLHLDGLADSADALLPCREREKALSIMKDPRIGAMGALALIFCVTLKTAAILRLDEAGRWIWLLAAPAIARSGLALVLTTADYARPEGGIGTGFFQKHRFSLLTLTPLPLLLPFYKSKAAGIAAVLTCLIVTSGLLSFFKQRIGGMTGDTLGAYAEILETSLFLAAGLPWANT